MYPPPGETNMGNFIAWDGKTGKIVWSNKEQFSVWSGALATAGDVVFYGTLEGYLKAVDAKTGKELYKFKTPSGIIGNVMTYEHGGRQYVAVLVRRRRLGGHRPRGWSDQADRRSWRGGRLRSPLELHRSRRHIDSVCLAKQLILKHMTVQCAEKRTGIFRSDHYRLRQENLRSREK